MLVTGVLASVLLTAPSAIAQTTALDGVWTARRPLPVARNEVALATAHGKLYVVGIAGNAVPMNDEYDPGRDTWRSRAPMPKGLDHIGIAAIDGKIYAIGGFIDAVHRGAVSGLYRYDPTTDHWQTLAPMKSPRGAVGVAVLDGKIHAIGGRGLDNTSAVSTH